MFLVWLILEVEQVGVDTGCHGVEHKRVEIALDQSAGLVEKHAHLPLLYFLCIHVS
jgi:hypothetical protein